jgi:hypothetical protein
VKEGIEFLLFIKIAMHLMMCMRLHEIKVFGAQHWNAMKNFFHFERCIKSQLEL